MARWLFKSEPDAFSWDDLVARGKAGEEWNGVRSLQARNIMREMKVGDRGFFYHSNIGKEAVGIVEVIATAHPDSTADDPKWERAGGQDGGWMRGRQTEQEARPGLQATQARRPTQQPTKADWQSQSQSQKLIRGWGLGARRGMEMTSNGTMEEQVVSRAY